MNCKMWTTLSFCLSLLQTQSAEETHSSSSCDTICITNSLQPLIDGAYHFLYFNLALNGSVYYNDNNRKYIYPFITSDQDYWYFIQDASDIGNDTAYSACAILNPSSGYIFDPYDCFDGWWTYDYYNGDPDQQIWKRDPNQRSVNCNNLVVTGNDHSALDGAYEWLQFNLITDSSIYYCKSCVMDSTYYLYAWPSHSQWQIGSDYRTGTGSSYCNYSSTASHGLKSLDYCEQWYSWSMSNRSWIVDENMAIDTSECLSTNATVLQTELDNLTSLCDMICITNSLREDLDGTYDLLYFNTTVNGPVYHNENNNKYLYPYIISEHEYNYLIQSQSSIGSGRASSSCSIYNPPSGYVFNPYDCFDEWWTYDYYHDDPDQQIWKEDPNQRLVNCNNLVATGNDQRVLDGTYEWSQFSLATGSSIYYCHECGAGVGTYLYTWPDFSEWQIGSDYVSGVRSSKCEYLNTQSNDLISIDDCIQWETWKWSKWILDSNFRVDKEECLLTISTTSVKTSALPIGSNENPNDKDLETLLILGMVFIVSIISFFIWAGISYAKHQKNLKKKQQAVQRTQAHKRELRFQETIELFKNERENRMTRQIELYEENKRKEQQQRQHHVQEIEEILLSRGFEQNYIQRAIKVYELDHGNLDG
eukprot:513397_1